MLDASPGVILLTGAGAIAAVYAFVCQIRANRIARAAVNRVRAARPDVWRQLDWLVRVANPTVKMKVLRNRHGIRAPDFDAAFEAVRRLERRQILAIAAAAVCVALVLIGTRMWGWRWNQAGRRGHEQGRATPLDQVGVCAAVPGRRYSGSTAGILGGAMRPGTEHEPRRRRDRSGSPMKASRSRRPPAVSGPTA
ncbi:MAG TPA: hypothetical protein VNN07_13670 [Candidatus Tectomicrobia bacterium]|nr:hypothetical protein [Candidatus Tectomicrobia bacterium]